MYVCMYVCMYVGSGGTDRIGASLSQSKISVDSSHLSIIPHSCKGTQNIPEFKKKYV